MSNLATVEIAGVQLRTMRTDDGFPGVVLADVLEPFGKRVDKAVALLAGWGRTRIERVPSRGGALGGRGGGPQDTTMVHVEDVPLLLAKLDQRGMTPTIKGLHTRFLVACRDVLAAHFVAPAPAATQWSVEQVIAIATRAAVEATTAMLSTWEQRRAESIGVIGPRRARRVLSCLGDLATMHAQRKTKAWRSRHRALWNELRDTAHLPLSGAWANVAESKWAEVLHHLDRIEKRERAAAALRDQQFLFSPDLMVTRPS